MTNKPFLLWPTNLVAMVKKPCCYNQQTMSELFDVPARFAQSDDQNTVPGSAQGHDTPIYQVNCI
uniref:Uncharacterized protein n=1 Tax=Arion vulgaris TaxID=1028688 RepID=A0A0B7BFR9_9EUPU